MLQFILRTRATSIITLLLIWLIFGFTIPRLTPRFANILIPVKPQYAFNEEVKIKIQEFENIRKKEEKRIFENSFGKLQYNEIELYKYFNKFLEENQKSLSEYSKEVKKLNSMSRSKKVLYLKNIDQNYHNKCKRRNTLIKILNILSPMFYSHLTILDLTYNGYEEIGHFGKYAKKFQEEIESNLYDKYTFIGYYFGNNELISDDWVDGFNPHKAEIPTFTYRLEPYSILVKESLIDVSILIILYIDFLLPGVR